MRDYTQMNDLQRRLGPRGLVVLGFPCNQFGHQVRLTGRSGGGRATRVRSARWCSAGPQGAERRAFSSQPSDAFPG